MRLAHVAGEVPGGVDCQLSVLGEVVLVTCRVDRLFFCTHHVAFDVVPGSRGLPLSCKLH